MGLLNPSSLSLLVGGGGHAEFFKILMECTASVLGIIRVSCGRFFIANSKQLQLPSSFVFSETL
jgi:hypothetical protein